MRLTTSGRTARPALIALAAVPVLLATLAGCSSDSSSGSGDRPSATTAAYDWDLAYASCMRDEGIDFPDPAPGQTAGRSKVDDEAAFLAADKKCTRAVDSAKGKRPVSDEDRAKRDSWNDQYAGTVDCLRKKGYEVETTDGGFIPKSRIPDSDFQACAPAGESSDATPR